MDATTKRLWLDLCSEAAICEDPERMGELLVEITALLEQERQRLDAQAKKRLPLRK